MKIWELDDAIKQICPIVGINSDGVIWFEERATFEQINNAKLLMNEKLNELEV